ETHREYAGLFARNFTQGIWFLKAGSQETYKSRHLHFLFIGVKKLIAVHKKRMYIYLSKLQLNYWQNKNEKI
ncbi:unnamed protein product, partial [Acanthocheilonema viteae]